MADVLIVGGGIIGCSIAIELAARKASVSLLEKHQPGTGATGASAGMLAPRYEVGAGTPLFRLAVDSRRAYPDFVRRLEDLGDWAIDFRSDGMLVANRTDDEREDARRIVERQHRQDRAKLLEPSEAREIHGGVSPEIPSWLWLRDEAQVDAQLLALALGSAVKRSGVDLRRGNRVTAIRARGGRVVGVRTETGEEPDAGAVVLAAGAWSGRVGGVPRALTVRPIRGQILRLRPGRSASWPLVASHDGHYVVPRRNGTVITGSTMEDCGFDDSVTDEGATEIAEHATALLPALGDAAVVERWAGVRPVCSDGMPVLGGEPRLDGLYYATGHGRKGVLLAPLTARILADLVLGGESSVPWEAFSPTRLAVSGSDSSEGTSPETLTR